MVITDTDLAERVAQVMRAATDRYREQLKPVDADDFVSLHLGGQVGGVLGSVIDDLSHEDGCRVREAVEVALTALYDRRYPKMAA